MKVAEILSDLTSLQVCVRHPKTPFEQQHRADIQQDPNAALTLVSARPNGTDNAHKAGPEKETDPDLERAKDLIALHADIKVAHRDGTDQDLNEAREAVQRVLRSLDS